MCIYSNQQTGNKISQQYKRHTVLCENGLAVYIPYYTESVIDLQILQMGGSIKKTLWQLCQLVVSEISEEKGCVLFMFTNSKLADTC